MSFNIKAVKRKITIPFGYPLFHSLLSKTQNEPEPGVGSPSRALLMPEDKLHILFVIEA